MSKVITKKEAINAIKVILDRHQEADGLDSANTIADLLKTLIGKQVTALEDGTIQTGDVEEFDLAERVGEMVAEGFTYGINPYWKLTVADEKILEDEHTVKRISDLIKGGFREGHHPGWSIEY